MLPGVHPYQLSLQNQQMAPAKASTVGESEPRDTGQIGMPVALMIPTWGSLRQMCVARWKVYPNDNFRHQQGELTIMARRPLYDYSPAEKAQSESLNRWGRPAWRDHAACNCQILSCRTMKASCVCGSEERRSRQHSSHPNPLRRDPADTTRDHIRVDSRHGLSALWNPRREAQKYE